MRQTLTVDSLLEKAEEAPVLFMKFKDRVDKYGTSRIYCFVEDYDMPYFSGILNALCHEEWTSIRCKGKLKVIEIHDYLKNMASYGQYKKRYFVDKDFDDNSCLDDDVYVTPSYSIENMYVTEECMRKILETEYEIDPVDDEELFNKTMSFFLQKRKEFHEMSLLLNACYASKYDDPKWCHTNFCLGQHFPKDIQIYSIEQPIVCCYSILDIERIYGIELSTQKVMEKQNMLVPDMTLNLRGKYELEFMYKFIQFLNNDAGKRIRQYTKKRKNYSFGYDGAITAMSSYASIPYGLKEYIKTGIRIS